MSASNGGGGSAAYRGRVAALLLGGLGGVWFGFMAIVIGLIGAFMEMDRLGGPEPIYVLIAYVGSIVMLIGAASIVLGGALWFWAHITRR